VAGAGMAGQPEGLAGDGGLAPPHRPAAQQRGPPPAGGGRSRPYPAPARRRRLRRCRLTACQGSHPHAAVPVLPPVPVARVAGRADPAGRRRRRPPRSPAFLVPEATMAQRISRAKQRIKAAGATFELPPRAEHARRLGVVVHVLYLIFNEGYTATSGDAAGASRVAGARRTRRAGCGHRNQRCATQPLRALRGPLADQLARPGGCRRTDWTTTRCALTRTFVVPAGGPNRTAFEPSTNP
jgi:hypothetical protein